MQRQYDSVNDLLGQLCYTSFGISGDIDECHAAVQEQTHNLNDFRDSLGAYNQGVIEMEDNLISKLSFIQESTNMSFKTDYDSGVNADAEVALIYISSLLTKRIDELSDDEKAYLEKVENMLGVENYKKLKELIWSFIVAEIQNVHVVDEKKLQDKFDRIKGLLENDIVINDPLKMNTIKQWITNDRRANLPLLRSTIGHTGKRILPIDYADHIKDSINLRKAPGEDKLKYLCDFLYDKFIGQIKNMNTNIADISGMDPKYAELYGDFSAGMLMESFAAISGAGIKSANALKNGEAIYDGDVVAGSGIGNLGGKGKAAHKWVSKAENVAGKTKYDDIKINTLSEAELSRITDDIRINGGSPIDIPKDANINAKTMNKGYQQIKYTWNDGTYKYESRWHTETPGAIKYDRGTTWVVTRKIPGNAQGLKSVTEYLVGDKWIDINVWKSAERANMAGTATQEQMDLLQAGHWLAK